MPLTSMLSGEKPKCKSKKTIAWSILAIAIATILPLEYIMGAEVTILMFGFFGFGLVPDISFIYLTIMTAIAMALFLLEGTSLNRKLKNNNQEKNA